MPMNPFFPVTSAHDTLWSLFAFGPAGIAAQFFLDPHSPVASNTATTATPAEERLQTNPQGLTHEPPPLACDTVSVQVHAPAQPVSQAEQEADSSQWLSSRFEHNNSTHHFKIYVPSGYDGQPLPMIVMLHGAQQNPDDFAAGTQMNAAAEAQGYIVVYPEQSESANPLRCWNWFRPADRRLESGEAAMVAALTREVMSAYNVDTTRVYVAGMSAGGAMAVNLAVTHPDLYAAAAIHSGVAFGVADEPLSALCAMNDGLGRVRLPVRLSNGVPQRAVPLIVFHGDADDIVHPRNCDQISAMSQLSAGAEGDTPPPRLIQIESVGNLDNVGNGHAYTRHVFHDHTGVSIGEQWLVHGLGHAWSGGNPEGTHTDVRGPQATQEIIRFFGQFALDN
jgi:poly(hydroxyalkanoate) depolymerase family esterase